MAAAKVFMQPIIGNVNVSFRYQVHFTTGLFDIENTLLCDVVASLESSSTRTQPKRLLFVIDHDVEQAHNLVSQIKNYFAAHSQTLSLAGDAIVLPGGETIKNEPQHVTTLHHAVNETGLDRHSYIVAIGGGALLDLAGYAAATAHRGVRLIRVPTTTLSQDDSGVGVKNGINAFGKKNFVGTFAPAVAVLNDFRFLETLPPREWRNGIAEAVKVALIKDEPFFDDLERDAIRLANRDMEAMKPLIRRSALAHVRHICEGGDPFEMGSSRPLDFGHWSAHKLEQITNYELRHGEAVAIGLALDVVYSHLKGWLSACDVERVLDVLENVGFTLFHPALCDPRVFDGLREFREHLGGELTIQMLRAIGEGFNVHEIDEDLMKQAIAFLQQRALSSSSTQSDIAQPDASKIEALAA